MLPTRKMSLLLCGVLAIGLFTGCAGDPLGPGTIAKHYRQGKPAKAVARKQEPATIETASIDKSAAPVPVTSRNDPRWQWCEQRHIDHQAGRAPGGATSLAQKLEDDRICAAVYERD